MYYRCLKHARIISSVGEPLDKILVLGSGNLKTVCVYIYIYIYIYICVCVCVCVCV